MQHRKSDGYCIHVQNRLTKNEFPGLHLKFVLAAYINISFLFRKKYSKLLLRCSK